ncbi:RNA polymerase sigma factor SigF, partial [Streptomyces sp. NPDC023327]
MAVTEQAHAHAVDKVAERAYADPSSVAPKDARAISRRFFDRLGELEEGTHEY